jgi:hypothetical protein
MKLVLGLVFALGVAAPAYADVSINDAAGTGSHDCGTDPVVSLNTSTTTLALTGACDKVSINGSQTTVTIESVKAVSINGSGNTLTVDAADKISVNGTANTVTYKHSVTPKKKTKIKKTGLKNTVTRVK